MILCRKTVIFARIIHYILNKKEKAKKIADTKWLNNDYVKFIALAQRFIEGNGKGIIGYITPNTHLIFTAATKQKRLALMVLKTRMYLESKAVYASLSL